MVLPVLSATLLTVKPALLTLLVQPVKMAFSSLEMAVVLPALAATFQTVKLALATIHVLSVLMTISLETTPASSASAPAPPATPTALV